MGKINVNDKFLTENLKKKEKNGEWRNFIWILSKGGCRSGFHSW